MKKRYLFGFLILLCSLLCGGVLCACAEEPEHTEHVHDYWEFQVTLEPTCTMAGKRRMICYGCGDEYIEEIPAGHRWGEWKVSHEADCLHAEISTQYCGVCWEQRQEISPTLPHDYQNGKCVTCGRRDWTSAAIDDPVLYEGEGSFRGLSELTNGAQMQELYLAIDEDARAFHTSGETSLTLVLGEYDYTSFGLDMDEAVTVWKAFMDDHPLYYWLAHTTMGGDVLRVEIDEAYKDGYYRSELNAKIYQTAQAWREDASEIAYAAALCYHDKLLDAVDYACDESGEPQDAAWAHNIAGVFEEKGAVCEGYARAFQLLLNASGIENYFVTGTLDSVEHAWNLVKLDDGKWYWADLTLDETATVGGGLLAQKKGEKGYNYFLVDEKSDVNWSDYGWETQKFSFLKNHTVDEGMGVKYMPALPDRASAPYSAKGELAIRDSFSVDGFSYALEGHKSVRVVGTSNHGDINIPETVMLNGEEYTVTSIGGIKNKIFVDDHLTVFGSEIYGILTIPKTVKVIMCPLTVFVRFKEFRVAEENSAFCSVDGVLYTKSLKTLIAYPALSKKTSLVLPNETTRIADRAFELASPFTNNHLKSIKFGDSFEGIGVANFGEGWDDSRNNVVGGWNDLFHSYPAARELKFSENSIYSVEDGILYGYLKKSIYKVFDDVKEVTVPASVETIGYSAFGECHDLQCVVFEEGSRLTRIDTFAFYECTSLTELELPEGLERIEDYAFTKCYALKSVAFPASLQYVSGGIFAFSEGVQTVTFAGSEEEWNAVRKDENWAEDFTGSVTFAK